MTREGIEVEALVRLTLAVTRYAPLAELLIDRGYLGSPTIGALHAQGVTIRAKAWTPPNGRVSL